ncbi:MULTISPECIES: 3-hydroxyacyl-CoA dehydrogenase [unclassified Methylobacterium]|uniref:3-hydroxyacyl-CoA dehydrogenase n=1 Tax=unclassified Methylobacterium TaxID=2615210 RepID=UPI00089F6702|nr:MULTISPECIES: 3-hydroxyacyl-CoA dehydrogenase [unclassified Methylobacterium]MBN4096392.1 3-hydroxyacyl-CoA dehydrogenase [Methylobacterium sp. OT2]SEF67765.1 3-hydroxyacyl-CoA dehydrogenase [Methylobacterium sp. 190mf]
MTESVAIVGAGLIGRAWAMIFARAGWDVRLFDPAAGVAEAAIPLCAEGLRTLAANDLCADPAGAAARIRAAGTLAAALDGVAFVQENGPERLEVKRSLFADLDAATPREAVIASSSSAIRCSLFTEDLPGRARCLVGHPVNPPHLIPLVEISGAPWTAPEVLARARQVYEQIGQVPITVLKEIEGFILNRLQGALLAEAFRLASEGYVTPQDLDKTVADGLGLRWSFMGPFETIELNAPGGIADYCARYTGFYKSLAADPAPPSVYEAPATEAILAKWQPPTDLPARMNRRDARLAALRAHKASRKD